LRYAVAFREHGPELELRAGVALKRGLFVPSLRCCKVALDAVAFSRRVTQPGLRLSVACVGERLEDRDRIGVALRRNGTVGIGKLVARRWSRRFGRLGSCRRRRSDDGRRRRA